MLLNYVKKSWQRGHVKVGLSADSQDSRIWLEARGITKLAVLFLSKSEKQQLAEISRLDAKRQLYALGGKTKTELSCTE